MLGPAKPRRLNQPIAVSLEDLVPRNHFYRHLEARFDLDFVRDWTRELYAERGRPGIDPVVFFKLQLILFFEGIRSERHLIETASLNLAHRWYLGYALDEDLPDHSSLTRIRERYGLAVFRRFFEGVVEQGLTAGLVWGQELSLDATKVAATASLDSLHPRFAVEAHLAHLFAAAEDASDGGEGGGAVATEGGEATVRWPVPLTEAAAANLTERAAQRHDWFGQAGRPNRDKTSGTSRRTADFRVRTTDPDATPMPRRCHAGMVAPTSATTTMTWSTAAGDGSC